MKAIVFFTILSFQMVSHYVSQAGIYLVNLNYLYLTFQVARMQVHTIKILMWKKSLYSYFKQTRFTSQIAFCFN